jgi:hypothetical protein
VRSARPRPTHSSTDMSFAVVMLGLGRAMAYPTLLAAIGDVAHAIWRGPAGGTSSRLSRVQVAVRGP